MGLELTPAVIFFGSNIVTFDLADGIVIIDPVPEPSTYVLFVLGVLTLVIVARRRA